MAGQVAREAPFVDKRRNILRTARGLRKQKNQLSLKNCRLTWRISLWMVLSPLQKVVMQTSGRMDGVKRQGPVSAFKNMQSAE